MEAKRMFRIAVDVAMFALLIATLVTMRGNLLVHTILGFVLVAFMCVHIYLTWNWIKGITLRFKKVKPKIKRQYLLNVMLVIAWDITIVTGIVLFGLVLNGAGPLEFAVLRRIHGVAGVIATVITVLHIFQHRKRLFTLLKIKKRKQPIQQVIPNPSPSQ